MRVLLIPAWPGLDLVPVTLGGVTVTLSAAAAAVAVLAASRSSAIAAPLRAAGNPLAACDYWAAALPYLGSARKALEATHRRGCAGRHVAKEAFCEAVHAEYARARAAFLAAAVTAMARDHRVAAEMAADAVAVRRRIWASRARDMIRAAADNAVRECKAQRGTPCAREAACGTGSCPFAPAQLAGIDVPAGPGRRQRPPCYAGGPTFSEAAVLEAWLELHPWRPAITVTSSDFCTSTEQAA